VSGRNPRIVGTKTDTPRKTWERKEGKVEVLLRSMEYLQQKHEKHKARESREYQERAKKKHA